MTSEQVLYRLILIKARRNQPSTERVKKMAQESQLLEMESTENSVIQGHIAAIQYAINMGSSGRLPDLEEVQHIHRMMMPNYPLAGHLRGGDLTMIDVNDKRVNGADTWAIERAYHKLFTDELSFCIEGMARHPKNPLPWHALARFHKLFEDIHGLWDGNGRVGRILVHWLKAYFDCLGITAPGTICLRAKDRQHYLQLLADYNIDGLADLFERSLK